MTQWTIELSGNAAELRTLSQHFPEPNAHAIRLEEEKYILSSSSFARLTDAGSVHRQVNEDILPSMKALMKLRSIDCSSVSASVVIQRNDNGSPSVSRLLMGSAVLQGNSVLRAEGTVIGPDGIVQPSTNTISATRLQTALRDANVRDALRLWEAYLPGSGRAWDNLFKVYEIIEADMGGGTTKSDHKRGQHEIESNQQWAAVDEIKSFRESANNPQVSGGSARHSVPWSTPLGTVPITEASAGALIQRILNSWLDFKGGSTGMILPKTQSGR